MRMGCSLKGRAAVQQLDRSTEKEAVPCPISLVANRVCEMQQGSASARVVRTTKAKHTVSTTFATGEPIDF